MKHREHQIHIMRTVCVMYKVVLRLNDLRSGYVFPHKYTHSSRGRKAARMEKEALLRHP